jgi:hypothetical protein
MTAQRSKGRKVGWNQGEEEEEEMKYREKMALK